MSAINSKDNGLKISIINNRSKVYLNDKIDCDGKSIYVRNKTGCVVCNISG